MIKEIGDVCWYITNIAVIQDLNFESIFDLTRQFENDLELFKSIEQYSGNIKKYYREIQLSLL